MPRTLRFFSVLLLSFLICLPAPSFAETVHYEYDASGNLVSDGEQYFIYNDANKLVQVRSGSATGPVLAEYVYDYTGRRIKKVENGATTYYFGRHYVKQVGGDDPGESFYYFANNRRVARKSGNDKMVYILSDHLAGANVTVDGSGNQIERTRYYPYGNIRSGGEKVRFNYTGKEKDRATDFYYYEARYYNPEFRHFTQPDSIAFKIYNPQNLNRYSYVQNMALSYTDPDGHRAIPGHPKKALLYPIEEEYYPHLAVDLRIMPVGNFRIQALMFINEDGLHAFHEFSWGGGATMGGDLTVSVGQSKFPNEEFLRSNFELSGAYVGKYGFNISNTQPKNELESSSTNVQVSAAPFSASAGNDGWDVGVGTGIGFFGPSAQYGWSENKSSHPDIKKFNEHQGVKHVFGMLFGKEDSQEISGDMYREEAQKTGGGGGSW